MMERYDVVVIGGGIAGAAAGFYLSEIGQSVALFEMEAQLAQHSTGRSAALYFENYGHAAIRPLSRASRPVFEHPIPDLSDGPLFGKARGALTVAENHQMDELVHQMDEAAEAGTTVHMMTPEEAGEFVPCLRVDRIAAALWQPDSIDIDVAACHQMFVRGMRRGGVEIQTSTAVRSLRTDDGGWVVDLGDRKVTAGKIVNAAGAWGDTVASLAGLPPIGLQPRRRTAFMVPGESAWSEWPLVVGAGHNFYFKPDGSQLLCSPSEEVLTEPGDPRPQEEDIALAIDTINEMTTLGIRTVRSAWTGLRTFAPDRSMVIGEDPLAQGFFWLVGQGGTGIQTAPASGRLLASLLIHGAVPADLAHVDLSALAPARFRR